MQRRARRLEPKISGIVMAILKPSRVSFFQGYTKEVEVRRVGNKKGQTIESSSPSPKRRAKSHKAWVVDSTPMGSLYENL